ncbi:hypothetical protein BD779DRAFT_1473567 [Infundibulicybe gibba]|nr:hypothetical protein BD779DRAFT_1473567 [Infundibulicybe gibba]
MCKDINFNSSTESKSLFDGALRVLAVLLVPWEMTLLVNEFALGVDASSGVWMSRSLHSAVLGIMAGHSPTSSGPSARSAQDAVSKQEYPHAHRSRLSAGLSGLQWFQSALPQSYAGSYAAEWLDVVYDEHPIVKRVYNSVVKDRNRHSGTHMCPFQRFPGAQAGIVGAPPVAGMATHHHTTVSIRYITYLSGRLRRHAASHHPVLVRVSRNSFARGAQFVIVP